jgi:hypothetical protein
MSQATVPSEQLGLVNEGRCCIILQIQICCRIVVIKVKRDNCWSSFISAWSLTWITRTWLRAVSIDHFLIVIVIVIVVVVVVVVAVVAVAVGKSRFKFIGFVVGDDGATK